VITDIPILSLIFLCPVVAMTVILCTPSEREQRIKNTALFFTGLSLVLGLWAFFAYDKVQGGLQFTEQIVWVKSAGISYLVGADGINLPMIFLTGIVAFCGVLSSWELKFRVKEFFVLFMFLVTGVFGVFMSFDMFFFFLFYEVAVLPMYLLISIWGSINKEYGALKLTIMLLAGSILVLTGFLALYHAAGLQSFSMLDIKAVQDTLSPAFQKTWFLAFFIGFGVLAAIWPLHTWSPDGHVAAPTAGSMLHAGVLMKLGAYGVIRAGVELLPEGAKYWAGLVAVIAFTNIIYGAFVAVRQTHLKFLIGYSSVSHMGIVMLGISTLSVTGMNGAVFQMFSHGIMTALMFSTVGFIYAQTHTLEIDELGGLFKKAPVISTFFIIAGLTALGLPGFSGFPAEFLVFVSAIEQYPWYGIPVLLSLVMTAFYVLRAVQRAFFGPFNPEHAGHLHDISGFYTVGRLILIFFLLLFGFAPGLMVDVVQSTSVTLMSVFS
jgi:NADH-quinone oxidoreductase subunit M